MLHLLVGLDADLISTMTLGKAFILPKLHAMSFPLRAAISCTRMTAEFSLSLALSHFLEQFSAPKPTFRSVHPAHSLLRRWLNILILLILLFQIEKHILDFHCLPHYKLIKLSPKTNHYL
jgi:hypothetical protein